MKFKEKLKYLYTILKGINKDIPITYNVFKEITNPPFISFIRTKGRKIKADNGVTYKLDTFKIELYNNIQDFELEESLEEVLDKNNLIYNVDYVYLGKEELYITIYTIEI